MRKYFASKWESFDLQQAVHYSFKRLSFYRPFDIIKWHLSSWKPRFESQTKNWPKKFFALCHFLAFCQFLWVYIDHLSEDFEKLFMAMLVLFLEIAFLIPNVDFRIRRQFFHYFSSLMYRFNQNKPSGA